MPGPVLSLRLLALSALMLCACTSLKSAHDTVGLADAGGAIHCEEDAGHDAGPPDAGMPDAGHDAGMVVECNDPKGFSGLGCYSCEPKTRAQLEEMMGDAPVCDGCGHITVRNGACYKCLNCGNSMGCS